MAPRAPGSCVLLLPVLIAAISGAARAEPPPYTIAPAPRWAVQLPVPDVPAPASQGAGQPSASVQNLLFDIQMVVEKGDVRRFFRTTRRLLSPQGLEDAAQLDVQVQPAFERLTVHWVRIRRGRQQIDALRPDDLKVLQRETGLEAGLYRGTITVHAVLHDVRIGDVVDLAYSVDGSNPIFGGKFVGGPSMAWSAPVARVHRRVVVPADRPIHVKHHGFDGAPVVRESAGQREYLWDRREVPAIEGEDRVPRSFEGDEPWVQLSEFASWNEVARWASRLFEAERPSSPELTAQIEQWRAAGKTVEERALAAFAFVRDEVRYFGVEIGRNAHEPQAPAVVFARRWGDCKDKTLLLVTALRAFGVDARPALVSTGVDAGLDSWHPSVTAFNHVLVRATIDGQVFWLDPTRTHARGDLAHLAPPHLTRALIVDPATDRLTVITPEKPAEPTTSVEEHFTLPRYDGDATLVVTTVKRREDADAIRADLADGGIEKLARNYLNFYVSVYPKAQAQGKPTVNDDPVGNVVRITERYTIPGYWSGQEHEFGAHELDHWLNAPRISRRRMPLGLAYPVHEAHVVRHDLPEAYNIPHEVLTEGDDAYQVRRIADADGKQVTVRFEYRSWRDQVAVKDVEAHLESLQKARKLFGYSLRRGGADGTTKEDELLGMIVLGGMGFGGLVVAVSFFLHRRRRGRRLRAEGWGATPDKPLEVTPAEARLGSTLPRVLCTCGQSQMLVQVTPIWHQGRMLVVAHVRCNGCGKVEVYHLAGAIPPGAVPPAGVPVALPPLPAPGGPFAAPWPSAGAAAPPPFGGALPPGPAVWQSGDALVARKMAAFPARCLRCNAPAEVTLHRALRWHEPWLYLTIFAGVLIYIIVAAIQSKQAAVDVPLCRAHDRARRRWLWSTIGLVVAGFACLFVPIADERLMFFLAIGGLLLLASVIVGFTCARVVHVAKIDELYVWLRKVSPEYLKELPPAPPWVKR